MEILLLGTAGGPRPSSRRAAPSQAVLHNGETHVVDCGSGVAHQLVKADVALDTLRTITITHHHADHMLDMGTLPLLAWTDGLQTTVDLFGPAPTQLSFDSFVTMMSAELDARTATTGRTPFPQLVSVSEVTRPGVIYDAGGLRITAAAVDHPPFELALGYRYDSEEGSVVFSGDTRYSENLLELAQGADVLVHEALHEQSINLQLEGAAARTLRDHLMGTHTTAADVGLLAQRAGVKRLVLSHLVPHHPGVTDEMWRSEASRHFSGEVIVAHDLMRIDV